MKFKEACAHSAQFLQSPAFKERVVDEDPLMLKYIPLLVQINKAGLLTNESQAGNEHNNKMYLEMERAYISGLMLESTAAEFIMYMGLYTDKNAVQHTVCGGYDDFKFNLSTPLTVQKNIKTGEIISFTSMPTGLPTITFERYKRELKINKAEKVVFVQCWDPIWKRNAAGRKGLFTEVLKILLMLQGAPTRNTLHPTYTRKHTKKEFN